MEQSEKKCCENCGKDEELEKMLWVYKQDKDNLIQILNDVQEHYGYIPVHAQKAISEYLSVPMAEIYGVITFYSRFTLKPKPSPKTISGDRPQAWVPCEAFCPFLLHLTKNNAEKG